MASLLAGDSPIPPKRYDIQAGRVSRIFIDAFAEELECVEGRQWNAERFIVFQTVILQRITEVRRARDIHQRVKRRIVEWREGWYRMMVEDTTRTSSAMILKVARGMPEEAILNAFTSLVFK